MTAITTADITTTTTLGVNLFTLGAGDVIAIESGFAEVVVMHEAERDGVSGGYLTLRQAGWTFGDWHPWDEVFRLVRFPRG